MSYSLYFWIRLFIAVVVLGFASYTIATFANSNGDQKTQWHIFLVVFWTIGPPTWFFCEYFAIDSNWIALPKDAVKATFLSGTKTYADYASKIWAAVLAGVLFLYSKS